MPTEDRRVGKQLPSPVTPPDTVCYTIQIPNAVQYRAAFLGQLDVLGRWETWDHQRSANDCGDCDEAAQLWRNALYNATFSDECGGAAMTCDDVADCIETSEAVQEAIAQQIASNPSNKTTVYETSVYGTPLGAGQRSEAIAAPPECDYDVLFAMCTAIIDTLHKNNEDFLEILEVATNPAERATNVIAAIPIVGLLPVDEAIEFLNQLAEEIQENYDAQYTSSIRDELRCALFCAAKDAPDCIITFDMMAAIFEDRLNYYLDPAAVALAFVQYFVNSTWAGTTVVDIMTLLQIAFWREASNWLGVNIRTLQIVARLAIDNPDPDWELLCTECDPEPPDEGCYPFALDDYDFTPVVPNYAVWHSGEGWGKGGANGRIGIEREGLPAFNRVTVTFNADVDFCAFHQMYYTGWATIQTINTRGSVFVFDIAAPFTATAVSIDSGDNDNVIGDGVRITEICIEMV